jgi:transposase-like protein
VNIRPLLKALIMPKKYSAEFRLRAVALVRAGGKTITQTAYELGVSAAALHNWVRQDRIDRGEISGLTSLESVELARAKRRIRELPMVRYNATIMSGRPHLPRPLLPA